MASEMLLVAALLSNPVSPQASGTGADALAPAIPAMALQAEAPGEGEEAIELSEAAKLPPAPPPPSPDEALPVSEIIVTARPADSRDPAEAVNVESFKLVQGADQAIVAPVAEAYEDAVPSPVRRGIDNFLNNLLEPIAALNFLLQLKPGKAFETLGRFAINSTFGVAGLVDVAKSGPFNLPRRPNGFANTLAYHGVKPGPFLFLPLIGPTTLRDLVGGGIDGLVYPVSIGKPFTQLHFTLPAGVLNSLNYRIAHDCELRAINDESSDPYAAMRDYYLWRRQAQIDELKGRPVTPLPVGTVAKCRAGGGPQR